MISIGRTHASNVKRWRDGQMALRDTLNKVTQTVGATSHDETASTPPDEHRAAAEVPRTSGHPPASR